MSILGWLLDVERHPCGPRAWTCGGRQRVHHGAVGSLLVVLGVSACAHDWKDRYRWFRPGR